MPLTPPTSMKRQGMQATTCVVSDNADERRTAAVTPRESSRLDNHRRPLFRGAGVSIKRLLVTVANHAYRPSPFLSRIRGQGRTWRWRYLGAVRRCSATLAGSDLADVVKAQYEFRNEYIAHEKREPLRSGAEAAREALRHLGRAPRAFARVIADSRCRGLGTALVSIRRGPPSLELHPSVSSTEEPREARRGCTWKESLRERFLELAHLGAEPLPTDECVALLRAQREPEERRELPAVSRVVRSRAPAADADAASLTFDDRPLFGISFADVLFQNAIPLRFLEAQKVGACQSLSRSKLTSRYGGSDLSLDVPINRLRRRGRPGRSRPHLRTARNLHLQPCLRQMRRLRAPDRRGGCQRLSAGTARSCTVHR